MNFFTITTKSGEKFDIPEDKHIKLVDELMRGRETRPQFIHLLEQGITINTDFIATIMPEKKEPWER